MFTKSAVNEAADVITARERLFYKLYTNNYRYARADRLEILNFIAIKLVAKYVAAATDTHLWYSDYRFFLVALGGRD